MQRHGETVHGVAANVARHLLGAGFAVFKVPFLPAPFAVLQVEAGIGRVSILRLFKKRTKYELENRPSTRLFFLSLLERALYVQRTDEAARQPTE